VERVLGHEMDGHKPAPTVAKEGKRGKKTAHGRTCAHALILGGVLENGKLPHAKVVRPKGSTHDCCRKSDGLAAHTTVVLEEL